MSKTLWKSSWYFGGKAVSTADAADALIENWRGEVECASTTSRNAVYALGRLVETLHEKGLLTTDEVKHVLDLCGYEVAEDNA